MSIPNLSRHYNMEQLFNRSAVCSLIFLAVTYINFFLQKLLKKNQTTQYKTSHIFIPQD